MLSIYIIYQHVQAHVETPVAAPAASTSASITTRESRLKELKVR